LVTEQVRNSDRTCGEWHRPASLSSLGDHCDDGLAIRPTFGFES
jgi:hypothetical protein